MVRVSDPFSNLCEVSVGKLIVPAAVMMRVRVHVDELEDTPIDRMAAPSWQSLVDMAP